jgi:hypothetical protein
MKNVTNVSIQITSINDNSTITDDLLEIRVRTNLLWGNLYAVWGSQTPNWNDNSLIEQMRRFPAGGLRCSFKQLKITQSYTNIYNSDTFGIASTNSSTKVATLTANWPADSVDYYITFNTDGYNRQYLITNISTTSLTYLDPSGSQPSLSGVKWLIKGYPKGEIFNILSYVVYYAPLTDQSYRTYRTEQDTTGANS